MTNWNTGGLPSRRPKRIAIWIAGGMLLLGMPLLLFSITQQGTIIMIHDISTDLEDPPVFEALLSRRAGASNPAEHLGSAVAAEQRRAFPDIQPLWLKEPLERVFADAQAAAKRMGWEIVSTTPERGRLEAVATTPLLRFKDDVVVRVTSRDDGVRVDVRSKSRVGRSDLGANARRIRAFLEHLQEISVPAGK